MHLTQQCDRQGHTTLTALHIICMPAVGSLHLKIHPVALCKSWEICT